MVIDESNFTEHFFDARKSKPKPNQVMARFRAVAAFGESPAKMDVVNLMFMDKARSAVAVMKKIHCAAEPDCFRVCREICEDLVSGMSKEEVCQKEYEFLLENFYYTDRENVPVDDPHWSLIELVRLPDENCSDSQ